MDILLFLFLTVTYGDPIFDELSSYEFPSNVVIIRATDNDFESFPIIKLGFFIWDIDFPNHSTTCTPWKNTHGICVDRGYWIVNDRKKHIRMINTPVLTDFDTIEEVSGVMEILEENMQYVNVFIIVLQDPEVKPSMKLMLSAFEQKLGKIFWNHVIVITFFENVNKIELKKMRDGFSHFLEEEFNVFMNLPFTLLNPYSVVQSRFRSSSEDLKSFILSKGQVQMNVEDGRPKRNYKTVLTTVMVRMFDELMNNFKDTLKNESLTLQSDKIESVKYSLIGDSVLLVGFSCIIVIVKYIEFRRKNTITVNNC